MVNPIEQVDFKTADGSRIVATLRRPEVGSRFPFAILVHGWRSSRLSDRNGLVAGKLADMGIGTLAIDFRGHGMSEGDIRQVSVKTEAEDILAAHEYLTTRREADLSRGVGIAGASIGGSAALYAMGTRPDLFRVGVLISPRTDFSNVHKNMYTFVETGETFENREMLPTGKKIDFYQLARRVSSPVLVLHGTNDSAIPITQSHKLVSANSRFRLEEIVGGDHMLRAFTQTVSTDTAQFLADGLIS